jgi:filamentous hemagglutinin family protein
MSRIPALGSALLSPLLLLMSLDAAANPTGGTVVQGQATFNTQGSTLTITNSPGAVINWQGFSIGAGSTTNFVQPSSSSAVLNRVVGANVSSIQGSLLSNGRVFLVNPNGVLIGPGAVIDTAAFTVSTSDISNADFAAGKHGWSGTGSFLSAEGVLSGEVAISPGGITAGNLSIGGSTPNLTLATAGTIGVTGTVTVGGSGTLALNASSITTPLTNVTADVAAGPSLVLTSTVVPGSTVQGNAIAYGFDAVRNTGSVTLTNGSSGAGGTVAISAVSGGTNAITSIGGSTVQLTNTGGAPTLRNRITVSAAASTSTTLSAASASPLATAALPAAATRAATISANSPAATIQGLSLSTPRPANVATISLQKREPMF